MATEAHAPFHQYVATVFLSSLPWRKRFGVLGQPVCNAARAVAAIQNAYVCAAAIGRARPDVVPKLVESGCDEGTWQAVLDEAAAQARSRIDAAGGSPHHFDQLFPGEFDPGVLQSTASFDSAYMLAQVVVIEGLALGKQHPDLVERLLGAYFRSVVETAKQAGGSVPPEMRTLKDFERYLLSLAAAWEAAREQSYANPVSPPV